jgi:hypothetical protein
MKQFILLFTFALFAVLAFAQGHPPISAHQQSKSGSQTRLGDGTVGIEAVADAGDSLQLYVDCDYQAPACLKSATDGDGSVFALSASDFTRGKQHDTFTLANVSAGKHTVTAITGGNSKGNNYRFSLLASQ